ncbi:MAG: GAF domain-containing protein [Anaerolineae bacterium]
MQSPLTDFGQQHLPRLFGLRIWAMLGAFVIGLLLQVLLPGYSLSLILALLLIEVVLSGVAILLLHRLAPRLVVHAVLGADVVLFTALVFATGGLEGGFVALYVWIVVIAGMVLGLSAGRLYSGLVLAGFVVNVLLEVAGVPSGWRVPHPLGVTIIGQSALFAILLTLAYVIVRLRHQTAKQRTEENAALSVRRADAERVGQRWAMVNAVALRIQESFEPRQVHELIGAQLEAAGLHVAIWEANAGDALHLAYVSLDNRRLQLVLAVMGIHPEKLTLDLQGSSYYQKCMQERGPVLVENMASDIGMRAIQVTEPILRRVLQLVGVKRVILAPMFIDDHPVGLFSFWGEALDASDIAPLGALAGQAASALGKANLLLQLQSRTAASEQNARELNLLFEALRATTATLEQDQVIARLLEKMVRAFDLTSAYFVELDEPGDTITIRQVFFAESATPREREILVHTRPIRDLPIIQKMLRGVTTVVQVDDPELSPAERALLEEGDARTALRVPLGAADRIIGLLSLWDSRASRTWSENEIRLVETIAAHTTVALTNARSFAEARSRTRDLEALYTAGQRFNSSLSVSEICQVGLDALIENLGYDHVDIYFLSGDRLRLQTARGYPETIDTIPITRGVMARAAHARKPILIEDVTLDPDYIAAITDILSELAVPLIRNDEVLGVLNIETVAPRQLTAADVRLLTTFATQLTISIDHARLFEEMQHRLAEIETLHQASEALNSDLTLDGVLNRVADYFLALLQVDTCSISRWDAASEELYILLDRDPNLRLQMAPGTHFPASEVYYTQLMLWDLQPHSFRRDAASLVSDMAAVLDHYQWSALLVVPLLGKGKLIGMLELGVRRRPRDFTADETRLAESLANQAAIAIENARLYAQAEQRLRETEALYRFTAALGEVTELNALGRIALDLIGQLIPFDFGGIALVNQEKGMIAPMIMTGADLPLILEGHPQETRGEPLADPGAGIVRWVIKHGETVRLGDVRADPRYVSWAMDHRSELCVPLSSGERVIGALNLESRQLDAFDEHAEQLLVTFANQFAIAIVNAQLYERTRQEAEVKTALLRELSHRVKNNLSAIAMLLQLALIEAPAAREEILLETLARAQSMITAHNLLAHSTNARVKLVELGEQVIQEAARQLAPRDRPVTVRAQGEPIEIAPSQLTTVALVLNELATNSILHGVNETPTGNAQIEFQVRPGPAGVSLVLSDNGKGLPEGLSIDAGAGLGLGLVRTLVEKDLHGKFTLERRDGWTVATVQFKPEE